MILEGDARIDDRVGAELAGHPGEPGELRCRHREPAHPALQLRLNLEVANDVRPVVALDLSNDAGGKVRQPDRDGAFFDRLMPGDAVGVGLVVSHRHGFASR